LKTLARPKSAILSIPSLVRSKLPPLISLCIMPCSCRYSIPSISYFIRHFK
jgi:hypothetical protein